MPNQNLAASRRDRTGFTLVELLVVMGVIACLVGILIPAVGAAKKSSRNLACQSNMKQLFTGAIQFTMDHKGMFPLPVKIPGTEDPVGDPIIASNGSFPLLSIGLADPNNGVYWKYIGNSVETRLAAIKCPDDLSEAQGTGSANKSGTRNFSYSFNSLIRINSGTNKATTLTRSKVMLPAERIYIMEEVGPNDTFAVMRNDVTVSDDDRPTGRHGNIKNLQYGSPEYASHGLGNFCFFDGHIEQLSPAEFGSHTPDWYNPQKNAPN